MATDMAVLMVLKQGSTIRGVAETVRALARPDAQSAAPGTKPAEQTAHAKTSHLLAPRDHALLPKQAKRSAPIPIQIHQPRLTPPWRPNVMCSTPSSEPEQNQSQQAQASALHHQDTPSTDQTVRPPHKVLSGAVELIKVSHSLPPAAPSVYKRRVAMHSTNTFASNNTTNAACPQEFLTKRTAERGQGQQGTHAEEVAPAVSCDSGRGDLIYSDIDGEKQHGVFLLSTVSIPRPISFSHQN
jgi:hypothetical protein